MGLGRVRAMIEPSEERAMMAEEESAWAKDEIELAKLGIYGHLAKACLDYFDYAVGLKNGHVIQFSIAEVRSPEWLLLKVDLEDHKEENEKRVGHPFERGVMVRLSEIAWCADAPNGS